MCFILKFIYLMAVSDILVSTSNALFHDVLSDMALPNPARRICPIFCDFSHGLFKPCDRLSQLTLFSIITALGYS